MGMKVEVRPVAVEELGEFEEVGACGTAAVISPICAIEDRDSHTVYSYCKDGKAGPVSTALYRKLQGIQFGEIEDTYGWTAVID